jgi:hypothetical protein
MAKKIGKEFERENIVPLLTSFTIKAVAKHLNCSEAWIKMLRAKYGLTSKKGKEVS